MGVEATWTLDGHHAQGCSFIRDGVGYSFMYQVADEGRSGDEPVLRRIIKDTEILTP
jgi:hypothetical protein